MFNKRPINPARHTSLKQGLDSGYPDLSHKIYEDLSKQQKDSTQVIALDGTNGANFQQAIQSLYTVFNKNEYQLDFISTDSFLKTGEKIRQEFKDYITDNRAFGYVSEHEIHDYFVSNAKSQVEKTIASYTDSFKDKGKHLLVIFGTGAHWLAEGAVNFSVYFDVSREYQELKYKKNLLNFGMNWNIDAVEKYKIAYFVEWPILEKYRKQFLQKFNFYVDMNDSSQPVFINVEELYYLIDDIAGYPMRVKPFFMPGIWGGQYLKKIAGLPDEMTNCAWNFEPIAPENSILLSYHDQVIELPFVIVVQQSYQKILGDRIANLFGDFFPIRMNYLDTIDGDNLSCQVHPKQDYIRETFNDVMEQQESYYVMEQQPDSKVYLGLTEQCTKKGFLTAVESSQKSGKPIPFTDYIQSWNANKEDLFLIPTGTVHASGKGNFVLEISATTWWYTFKVYDYVRKDLDGKPRPINIEYGFDNIDFSRKTSWVKDNLMTKPKLLQQQGENQEFLLGKRDDLVFYVNRIHVTDEWNDHTNGEFILLNLVEGEHIKIISSEEEDIFVELHYAEAYIIPGSFGSFKIRNLGKQPCKIIKAGVSDEWDVSVNG